MMIPAKTYGPTEKVKPKEEKYMIGYTDNDGNDYIGICPDLEKEPWFNDLIQEDGLENLCKEYPYQPLKVDKDSGLLVPVFSCDYNAKLTNCFHVLYHMRKDQNHSYEPLKLEPSIDIQESNFVEKSDSINEPNEAHSPNWSSAYHHETPKIEIHDVNTQNFISSEEEQYGIKNIDVTVTLEDKNIPSNWHPNDQPYYQQQYYPYNPYGMNQMISNTQMNPYTYNPAYQMNTSYLPQYKTINNQVPFIEDVEEYMMRARDREKANMEYATKMNLDMRTSNPTFLENSNTIDFSNPESVAKMQGLYANPYYNNLNNPNFAVPNNYPYGINNPYGGIINPIYNNNPYMGGYGYLSNPWFNNLDDTSFMEYSDEEIKANKGFDAKPIKVNINYKQEKPIIPVQFKDKKKETLEVQAIKVPRNDITETKEIKEEELDIYEKLDEIDRPINRYKRYGDGYKKQVEELAKKLIIYDEARAMCLLGSLDDPRISMYEFKLYYKACEEKLYWYETEEKIHTENDYRVPFRYRKNPKLYTDSFGQTLFQKYTIPMKRKFKLSDGKVIDFYAYDRGREPNKEEWQDFYDQAVYERKIEIELIKVKVLEEYEREQLELNQYNPNNMMDVRLHEMRMEDKLRRDQYQVFRDAYGFSISDDQFNQWWYKYNPNPQSSNVKTEEDYITQRKEWRRRMSEQRQIRMHSIVPLNLEEIRNIRTNQINHIVREFDNGVMDSCSSLKDFFDNLGYLNVRVCEENIKRQREEELNASLSVNRYDYSKNLFQMAQPENWSNHGVNDPYYQNRPHYMEFVNSQDYEEKKHQFFDYCSNTKGAIPLRPIYQ